MYSHLRRFLVDACCHGIIKAEHSAIHLFHTYATLGACGCFDNDHSGKYKPIQTYLAMTGESK